ncbi:hypothetical protein K431DRAFT_127146 [Polychaeton citri CBS 116435]|uniref:Uncharacterized protein n=1 Tax=Polychaeton citri CBS 116435 TaxID=1314669 RepID=A0A9P4Q2R4_9PEZI|nr:hypothetical protein K431DRAFT_127146 [Polychaeton citri CBS 116435]
MVLNVHKPTDAVGAALEAWAQGFLCGSLVVMIALTLSNMRRKVLLHKLILIELLFGVLHGTFILTDPPVYNWYLSTTAVLLNISWSLHNVIAWLKTRPFLSRKWSLFYIGTIIIVQPYWILEIVANFLYFSDRSDLFQHTRPYEAIFRDPWWIFTICLLFYQISTRYDLSYITLIRVSPRFGVLLTAMIISVVMIILDILSVTKVIRGPGLPDGINPFWKLAFVFKCLTDAIVLDDFKTALDKLKQYKLGRMSSALNSDPAEQDLSSFSGGTRLSRAAVQQSDSYPSHQMLTNPAAVRAQEWASNKGVDSQHIDLEAALRMDSKDLGEIGESSRSSGS